MKLPIKLLFITMILAAKSVSAEWLGDGPLKVTRILDGDTIEVTSKDDYTGMYKNYRIRLNSIDAPEKSQQYGQRSRQFLADFIGGQDVIINSHGKDRYGRILGDVMVKNCKPLCLVINVNEEMVKTGMAWAYRYKGKPTNERMVSLEDDAKAASEGLWADKNAVEPWRYRRLHNDENE